MQAEIINNAFHRARDKPKIEKESSEGGRKGSNAKKEDFKARKIILKSDRNG